MDVSKNIMGKTFCPLGDGAAGVVQSFINNFREEFEERINSQ
jgi:NADH:ubiquinone oxidoreductase subunit F (NADH-binding)